MLKKLIILGAIVLVGYIGWVLISNAISEKKTEEEQRAAELQRKADQRAQQTWGDKVGITGGNAGFGGVYTQTAHEKADKAYGRSDQAVKQMEDQERQQEQQSQQQGQQGGE